MFLVSLFNRFYFTIDFGFWMVHQWATTHDNIIPWLNLGPFYFFGPGRVISTTIAGSHLSKLINTSLWWNQSKNKKKENRLDLVQWIFIFIDSYPYNIQTKLDEKSIHRSWDDKSLHDQRILRWDFDRRHLMKPTSKPSSTGTPAI